jgi:hypothetical protein
MEIVVECERLCDAAPTHQLEAGPVDERHVSRTRGEQGCEGRLVQRFVDEHELERGQHVVDQRAYRVHAEPPLHERCRLHGDIAVGKEKLAVQK